MVRRVVAVAALVPILLVSGCGSGKPKPKATVASSPATTTGPTSPAPAAKHHAKAAVRHHAVKRRVATKHVHHQHHSASTTPRTSTTHTSPSHTSTTPPPATPSSSITLDLLGRSGDATSSVCAAPRHYRTYRAGQVIGISGHVSPIPSAIWKVKVKIKVCSGPVFTDYVKIDATLDKHHGTFSGSFPAPAAGFYQARAELYVNDSITTESTDVHFKTL